MKRAELLKKAERFAHLVFTDPADARASYAKLKKAAKDTRAEGFISALLPREACVPCGHRAELEHWTVVLLGAPGLPVLIAVAVPLCGVCCDLIVSGLPAGQRRFALATEAAREAITSAVLS